MSVTYPATMTTNTRIQLAMIPDTTPLSTTSTSRGRSRTIANAEICRNGETDDEEMQAAAAARDFEHSVRQGDDIAFDI